MEFKERLKELRNSKYMTVTTLAAHFGKSEGAIRMWETGRATPDIDTLIKLADFFECTTDYLLGRSKYKNQKEKVKTDEMLKEISFNVERFEFKEKEAFYFIFQGAINIYFFFTIQNIDDIIKKEYLTCLKQIVDKIADSRQMFEIGNFFNEDHKKLILADLLSNERESITRIQSFYSLLYDALNDRLIDESQDYRPEII